jgi:DNA-binding transcriptional regulator LsrR (DeoR family)
MTQASLKERFLVRVLKMHYLENLTQQAIAQTLGISRASVVRLLAEGKDRGMVKVVIEAAALENLQIEEDLRKRYGLADVVISDVSSGEIGKVKQQIGRLASEYLLGCIREGTTVAVSAGSTLYEVAMQMMPTGFANVSVVSMHGGINERSPVNPNDVARTFAERTGANCYYINAPALAESETTRSTLLADSQIRAVLDRIRGSQIALVGIGDLTSHTLVVKSCLPDGKRLIAEVLSKGAVGEALGHYFTALGQKIECELVRRIVGIEPDGLKGIPKVIAVAAGESKTKAIASVLRSGYCNILITDSSTGRQLLSLR